MSSDVAESINNLLKDISAVLYAADEGLRGRNVLQSVFA